MEVKLKSSKLFTVEDFIAFSSNRDLFYITLASLHNALESNEVVVVLYGNQDTNLAVNVNYGSEVGEWRVVNAEYLEGITESDYIIYDEFLSDEYKLSTQVSNVISYLSYLLNSSKLIERGKQLHRKAIVNSKFSQLLLSAKHNGNGMDRAMYQSMEHPKGPNLKMKEEFMFTSHMDGKDPQTQHYIHTLENYNKDRIKEEDILFHQQVLAHIQVLNGRDQLFSEVERDEYILGKKHAALKDIVKTLKEGKECKVLIGDLGNYRYITLSYNTPEISGLSMCECLPTSFSDYDYYYHLDSSYDVYKASLIGRFISVVVDAMTN